MLVPSDGLWHSSPNSTEMHQVSFSQATLAPAPRSNPIVPNCTQLWASFLLAAVSKQLRLCQERRPNCAAAGLSVSVVSSMHCLLCVKRLEPRMA